MAKHKGPGFRRLGPIEHGLSGSPGKLKGGATHFLAQMPLAELAHCILERIGQLLGGSDVPITAPWAALLAAPHD
jgi:hypothetical protein